MNRKLLVNELLGWSEISETNNEKIINLIETHFKPYSELKRSKTLPKKLRLKKKTEQPTKVNDSLGVIIKKQLRFGINSITRELEKDATNLKFVLVCKSCKPILTRHIQIMCAKSNVPAGCVTNLSCRLAKFFNLNTISAFAIVSKINDETNQDLLNQTQSINSDLENKIIELLPSVKDPFSAKTLTEDFVDVDMPCEATTSKTPFLSETAVREDKMETTSTFGSDFISFKEPETKISFNSRQFILFNDDYSEDESEKETDSEIYNQLVRTPKRKLTKAIKMSNSVEFNQFSIKIRPTNKDRKKTAKQQKNSKTKTTENKK